MFEEDVYETLTLKACVNEKAAGGPAPETVKQAIEEGRAWLKTIIIRLKMNK